jgi:hypothetical protein
LGCGGRTHEKERALRAEPFSTIATRGITEAELAEAIAKLKMPVNETPQYWTRIANDSSYSTFHRRCAVFQLFKRHVHVGMRLSELAHLLDHPTWLGAGDIHLVEYVGGYIPVRPNIGDTVFLLEFLPEARNKDSTTYLRIEAKGEFQSLMLPGAENHSVIYLCISGKVDVQGFRNLVLGSVEANIRNATVLEVAISEP